VGLEPACVVVCPEHAIVAGDMNDPASEISHVLATAQATVRKPEQGTGPKLFYINGNDWSLHPTASPTSDSYMWADKVTEQNTSTYALPVIQAPTKTSISGTPIRTPQEQGRPLNGPIQIGGRVAEQMVQTAYNAQHKIQWHWELPLYLVTKNIAGGLFMLLSLGAIFNFFPFDSTSFLAAGFTSMLFTLITVILLIKDLSRPERFLNILLRPQWKSWVAGGAFILIGFTAIAGLWWLIEGATMLGWLTNSVAFSIRPLAAWITLPLALFSVIYSAFLLGQAEGRDMWQTPLLPFQLLSQSFMVASGVFLILGLFVELSTALFSFLTNVFIASLVINLIFTLVSKFAMPFASEVAMLASREMSHGRYRNHFWWGGVGLGHVIPFGIILIAPSTAPIAALAVVVGLFFYEYAFVMAPQHIPNS
jgi:formate-dependent nitrite reductase membrane component NrfD